MSDTSEPSVNPESPTAPLTTGQAGEPNSIPSAAIDDLARTLSDQATEQPGNGNIRKGEVIEVGFSLTITLGGEPTEISNVPYIDSYAPFVGDNVWVMEFGGQLLVLGGQTFGGAGLAPGAVQYFWTDEAPSGWIEAYGQDIDGCDVLFPGLWAYAPAAAKSGTTLTLPDLRGRMTIGLDDMGGVAASRVATATSVGASGGFSGHNLVVANLPGHTHAFGVTSGAESGHTHSNGSYTTGAESGHTHGQPAAGAYMLAAGGAAFGGGSLSNLAFSSITGGSSGHTHGVTGTSGGSSGHTHGVSGTTDGGSGTGTTVDHMNPWVAMRGCIKL